MKVIADVCIVPMGVGASVSKYITECHKVLAKYDLKIHLHAYGTNLEGEWDTVFAAIKACHEHLHQYGAPRLSTSIKVGTRTDKDSSIEHKIQAVQTGA